MNTRKVFGYGFLAVALTLALVACEQPIDSPAVTVTVPALSGTISISPSTGVNINTELTANYSGSEIGITYQWKKDGANVGTNSNKYIPTAAGSYTVTVSATGYQSKTSAAVDVGDPSLPTLSGSITISPASAVTGTELTANYTGSETVNYQWRKDGGNVGENSNKYTPTAAGSYTVTVSATGYNSKTSAAVTVTAPALTGITLNTTSVKKAYNQNEPLNLSGLIVTAAYSDGSSTAVTGYTPNPANGATLSTTGTITVTISYTEGAVTRTADFTVTVSDPSHSHSWGAWTVTTAATCMATGIGVRYCTECNEQDSNTTIPINPNAHQLDPGYFIIPPTCTTAGSGALVCLLNSAHSNPTAQVVLPVDPNAHNWSSTYGEKTAATETTDGIEAIMCTHNNAHFKEDTSRTTYATGTLGLAYELIGSTSYCVRKGTVTDGVVHIPSYHRPDANSPYLPVTEIGSASDTTNNGAFYNTSITSITIPDNITIIGAFAFADCTDLTSITLPESVTEIGDRAFRGCTSLTAITLPESVMSIGASAFNSCTSLTGITIPAGVTSIGDRAFVYCISLTSITVNAGNTNYLSEGGILYNKAKTQVIAVAPAGINSNVTLPESVMSIGVGAFYACTSLASVTFASGSQLKIIGEDAFSDCTSLTEITIPAGVIFIGPGAFYNWTSSQIINIEGHINQASADTAWYSNWRVGCNAVIKYWNGSSYQ
jgi:hypothetical protein